MFVGDAHQGRIEDYGGVRGYAAELMHPYYAAENGLVDDVIDPATTRAVLAKAMTALRAKQTPVPHRKHGNPPV